MSEIRLCVLGIGGLRCSVPVIVSLASFFGERPIEIAMYDSDEERLDLFDRFARLCFGVTQSTHLLRATLDPVEAADNADKVLVQVGPNCARKFLGRTHSSMDDLDDALVGILEAVSPEADVLSLLGDRRLPLSQPYDRLSWPQDLTAEQRRALPLDILRQLNGEDYLHQMIKDQAESPLRAWLNQPIHR
jgi:hypothetical protein